MSHGRLIRDGAGDYMPDRENLHNAIVFSGEAGSVRVKKTRQT